MEVLEYYNIEKRTYEKECEYIPVNEDGKLNNIIPIKEKYLKNDFLKLLPYLYVEVDTSDRIFISRLIKSEYLSQDEQKQLIDFFDTYNPHWRKWDGEFIFEIWILFSDLSKWSIFSEELLDKERLNIIQEITHHLVYEKWLVGKKGLQLINNYANKNLTFKKQFSEKLAFYENEKREENKKYGVNEKGQKTKDVSGYKINILEHLQGVIPSVNIPGLRIEFTEEEYKIIMKGHRSKTMEDKWDIIPDGEWLHFCRSWTHDEIYKAEMLPPDSRYGNYRIAEFFFDKSRVDENVLEYIDYSIYVIITILYWGILKKDIRHFIFDKYGQDDKGLVKLWSELGNMLFTD